MVAQPPSSRRRFVEYRRKRRQVRNIPLSALEDRENGQPKASRRSRSFGTLLKDYIGLMRGHRRPMALALITLTFSTSLGLIPPAGTKIVVDYVLIHAPLPSELARWLPADRRTLLAAVALAMIGLALVALAIGMSGRYLATRTVHKLKASVRKRVFEHSMRLPLHRVYQLKTGGAASILNEDTGTLSDLIFSMIYNPWRAIVQLIGSLIVLALVDWRLLACSLVIIPIVFVTHRTWIGRIRPIYRDIHASRQEIDSHATEAFGGVRVVRTFGRQVSESARFVRNNHFRARQELYAWWWARAVDIAWRILIPIASAGLLWYGGLRVLDQALTVGDLMMFLAYLIMLLGPLETLAVSATQFQTGLAGLDRVLDLLAEPREMPSRPGAIAIWPDRVQGRISLREVSFAYPGTSKLVIQSATLDVAPGEMIALVGPSGSGKTTMCNLIARFYDPTSGAILLDDRDLRDIQVESYRRLLGIVEQDIFLFDGTVAQNIAYARREAHEDEIIGAARQANAHRFISEFEHGYKTVIGERGVRLSGGQRQRIAIARAILADPRILILDEATSNLDTESERLIQVSLTTLMKGRTTFVIAHRLSTIAHADRIVVIENGHIIEQGPHLELMARSGAYRRMVELQTHQHDEPAAKAG